MVDRRQLRRLHDARGRDALRRPDPPARSTSSASRTSSRSWRTPRATGAICAASNTATSAIRQMRDVPRADRAAQQRGTRSPSRCSSSRARTIRASRIAKPSRWSRRRARTAARLVPARRQRRPRLREQGERRLPVLRDDRVHRDPPAEVMHRLRRWCPCTLRRKGSRPCAQAV